MLPAYLLWLAAAVLFAVIEAATLGLTSVWFALGALAAMVCALLHLPFWTQLAAFVLVAAVTVWFVSSRVRTRFNRSRKPTNADRIIGRAGVVEETIDNPASRGVARVDGVLWTARSLDGAPIPAGTVVTVRAIEGVKALVAPKTDRS